MNRDIRFRAWDKSNSEMVNFESVYIELEDGCLSVFKFVTNGHGVTNRHELDTQEGNVVLMQYTGLKDKNGVEIYEGDIVREKIGYGTESRAPKKKPHVFALGVVDWQEDRWVISHKLNNDQYWESVKGNETDWYRVHYGWKTTEVIGNIYEHPNLLKDGETA